MIHNNHAPSLLKTSINPNCSTCFPRNAVLIRFTYEINLRICLLVTPTQDQYRPKLSDQSHAFSMHHTMIFLCESTGRLILQGSHSRWMSQSFRQHPPPGARASDSPSKCPFLILQLSKSSTPFMATTHTTAFGLVLFWASPVVLRALNQLLDM